MHRDNWRYKDYCLEYTCNALATKFPESYVWLVKPNEMFLKTWATYTFIVLGMYP